ncbi:MAG: glutathione S-transferase N-terminal domain-containing protein [Anaerolineae bacterium]|nr:glutathione S-transferase N-terminal domain-containing protein [Anaerolineae bacterium]
MANFCLPAQPISDAEKITLYGHADCPLVPRVRVVLEQSGAPFEYVDIHSNEAGRLFVRDVNHGHESVPTLVFPDGAVLTESSNRTLRNKLTLMGYAFQKPAWVTLLDHLLRQIGIRRA